MRELGENPREESGAHRLSALLRNDATQAVDGARNEAAWHRLLMTAHEEDGRALRKPRPAWLLVPGVAGVVLMALGLVRFFLAPTPLHVKLDGHEFTGDLVASEDGLPRNLEFSDGSNLVLRSSGRLRVTGTEAHGATLLLDRGQLQVSIRHRPLTHWRFDVGPYVVSVTGTLFGVAWEPEAGDFAVDLVEGAVNVRGPGISTPITLQAGQQLRANKAGNYTVQRQEVAPEQPVAAAELPGRDFPAVMPRTRRAASGAVPERAAAGAPEKPSCDWASLVSSGRFEVPVAQARQMGVEAALAECPTRSLFVLADAARYLGKFDLSKNALLSVRKRSPVERSRAAFFLGRLEEARGNLDLALGWYSQAMEGNVAKAGKARIVKRIHSVESRSSHVAPQE